MFKLTPFNASPRRREDFDSFNDIFEDFFAPMRSLRHDTFKIDVEDKDSYYEIKADLPGVNKEDVKVSYDDQNLNIHVERSEEKEEKDEKKNYLHRERRVSSMKRSIYLPNVDPAKFKAKLENGVLLINAEKTQVQEQGYVVDVE